MVDEVEEKSAIDNDDILTRFGKALQFGLDQPLERIADTFKSFGFNDTEKFLRDLTEATRKLCFGCRKIHAKQWHKLLVGSIYLELL